jgi:hypothetical protein
MPSPPSTRPSDARERRSSAFIREDSGIQGSHSSIRKTHKSTVMREFAVPEESGQHRESLK